MNVPYEFVFEELAPLEVHTKPMFGCLGMYVGPKIIFIQRLKSKPAEDDGLWVATTGEHHASLHKEFPSMRSISIFGPGPTGWQVLPADADDFEESVQRACALVRRGDPRIGKIPKTRVARGLKTRKKK
jgi:hypothetical protein